MSTYTTTAYPDNSTMANFLGWAGGVAGLSYALAQVGCTLMADTYTAQWSAASTIGSAALPTAAGGLNTTVFPAFTNFQRSSQLASTNFLGAYAGGTTYSKGNVVTFTVNSQPLVYVFINATPTAGQAPMSFSSPTYTLNSTYWAPYYMEVWKMHSGSLNDIYFKLEYGCASGGVNWPFLTVSVGNTYSTGASGYLSGNVISPQYALAAQANNASTAYNIYVSGDGGSWLNVAMFNGDIQNTRPGYFGIERQISSVSGSSVVYGNTFYTLLAGQYTSWWQQNGYFSGAPGTGVRWGGVQSFQIPNSGTGPTNNLVPVSAAFPSDGYIGNPLTIFKPYFQATYNQGYTAYLYDYGANHTYMQLGATPPYQYMTSTGGSQALIRWE